MQVRCSSIVSAITLVSLNVLLIGQGGTRNAEFEVASLRPNADRGVTRITKPPRGFVSANNVSLKMLIERAYGLRPYQLDGIEQWMVRERFDLVAKPPAGATPSDVLEMLKSLLAERFGLQVQEEVAERPLYELVVARPDRLGQGLRKSQHDCDAFFAEGGQVDAKDAPRDAKGRFVCGRNTLRGPMIILSFGGATMAHIASRIAEYADREVVDRTALPGTFDVDLYFKDIFANQVASIGSEAPDIFQSVQEQLGLKLQSQRGPTRRLIIQAAHRPTPN